MEVEKIKRQARQILDSFADALKDVEKEAKLKEGEEGYVERDEFERIEEKGDIGIDPDFRQSFLKNAPAHDDDFVIAEKGDWK